MALLDAQTPSLIAFRWGLFTNDVQIGPFTVLANLTIAGWTGFAEVLYGASFPATIVDTKGVAFPHDYPSFTNSSGADVTYYGWYLRSALGGLLVAAVNMGPQTLPDGGVLTLNTSLSDQDKGD